MERSCEGCPMRASCQAPCPEIEAQLAAVTANAPQISAKDLARFQEQGELIDAMRALSDCLTAAQKEVFDAYYQDGKSHQEIADALGVGRSAVTRRLIAARARIIRQAIRNLRG